MNHYHANLAQTAVLCNLNVTMTLFSDQILLINKPKGWTSFDVVKKTKGILKVKKIGHAGTLDPLATGLLVLAVGKKTKEIPKIQEMEKEYRATICIGATTPTLDLETTPAILHDTSFITSEEINKMVHDHFIGEIEQTPPQFSAVKINGKRAYDLARSGKTAEIKPKKITIHSFQVENPRLIQTKEVNPEYRGEVKELRIFDAIITCSKGTYVRSIANDLAKYFNTQGMLLSLERTRIGDYNLGQAETLDSLVKQMDFLHL